MLFWISWIQPTEDYRPLTYPPTENVLGWWCSGVRSDGANILCAYIVATDVEAAKNEVRRDWPEAVEWRFCETRDSVVTSDRFPLKGWMVSRVERYKNSTENK